jgi:hypothetical protein
VIVAVILVRMMQVAVDQVIDMVAVRDGFVAAARAVLMGPVVSAAGVFGRARGRVGGADLKLMLLDSLSAHVVKVAVVQVVRVVAVLDRGVATAGAVPVRMVGVMVGHVSFL